MTPAWTSQPLFSTPTFTLNPHSQQPLRNHTPRYSSCAQPVGLVLPPLPFVVCCALYFYHLQQKSLQLSLQGKASQAPLMILITKSLAPGVLKGKLGDFPGGPEVVISPCIARRGVGGGSSLVRELRSHMLSSQKTKTQNRGNILNKQRLYKWSTWKKIFFKS